MILPYRLKEWVQVALITAFSEWMYGVFVIM